MTVRINKPALNLREELTKAQGVVRYAQRQFWAGNLVNNGTFDSDVSSWTLSSGGTSSFTFVSGQGVLARGDRPTGSVYQAVDTVIGKTYQINVDKVSGFSIVNVGVNSGSSSMYAGTNDGSSVTATFVATTSKSYININNNQPSSATVDNISIIEVDENDDAIYSVPLGFKPVHVYEDGLLQREGENYDYTVVDTGFEYQIKPTVAPSATTETCVIAEREL